MTPTASHFQHEPLKPRDPDQPCAEPGALGVLKVSVLASCVRGVRAPALYTNNNTVFLYFRDVPDVAVLCARCAVDRGEI